MYSPRKIVLFLAPALLLAVVGCGGGPKVVKVTGTLTYKGKPVPDALINFQPENGRQSWAQTDENGRFKVNYDRHQDGAMTGKHKVWLDYRPNSQTGQEAMMMGKAPPMTKEMRELFDRYSHEKSKLEITIDKAKDIELKLD